MFICRQSFKTNFILESRNYNLNSGNTKERRDTKPEVKFKITKSNCMAFRKILRLTYEFESYNFKPF